MNFDGNMVSSILPPMPVKADLRAAPFQAANDPKRKFMIARTLVQAKIARSLQVLDWLGQRYDIPREIRVTQLESSRHEKGTTVADLRVVEGRVARRYWDSFGKVLPEHLDLGTNDFKSPEQRLRPGEPSFELQLRFPRRRMPKSDQYPWPRTLSGFPS